MGDAGACQTSNKKDYDEEDDDAPPAALDEGDIALLKTYGLGPYTTSIKDIEKEINEAKVRPPRCVFLGQEGGGETSLRENVMLGFSMGYGLGLGLGIRSPVLYFIPVD